MAAKGAGELDLLDHRGAEMVHHQFHARIKRGLGELDGAHIILRDLQRAAHPHAGYR